MKPMKKRAIFFVCLLALAVGCSSAFAKALDPGPRPTPVAKTKAPQMATPEDLVADLYRAHKNDRTDPFFDSKSRVSLDNFFTKSLADLICNDSVTSAKNNEVGVIDGDPLYDAQDMEIKNFAIGKAEVNGETAVVPVTFINFGDKHTIKFDLKRVGNLWQVDDIDYGNDEGSLRKEFAEDAASHKKPGN
jgi:hypothetical protein